MDARTNYLCYFFTFLIPRVSRKYILARALRRLRTFLATAFFGNIFLGNELFIRTVHKCKYYGEC